MFNVPSIDRDFTIDDICFDTPVRAAPPRSSVRLRDGQRLVGQLLGWNGRVIRIQIEALEDPIVVPLARVDAIDFGSTSSRVGPEGSRWVRLDMANGDRLSGRLDSWERGRVRLLLWGGESIDLPEDQVVTLKMPGKFAKEQPGEGVRIVRGDEKMVTGSTLRLSERRGEAVFLLGDENGGSVILPLSEIARIDLSVPKTEPRATPPSAVIRSDGGLITGSIIDRGERRIRIRTPYADRVTLYRSTITRLEFF